MWWFFFAVIQIINLPLMVVGWFLCLSPIAAKYSWLWWNSDNPPTGTWLHVYYELAWRNPVSNLRKLPFVAGSGRPMYYKTWTLPVIGLTYVKVGWENSTPFYPVLSAGAGKGF